MSIRIVSFLLMGFAVFVIFFVVLIIAVVLHNQGNNKYRNNNFTNQDNQDDFMNQMMHHNMNDLNYNGIPDTMEHLDQDGDGIPDYLDNDNR